MTGPANGQGPAYISAHSADVILSDIRPIKLQIDALRCINVLLDEFLYNILSSARSLSPDKLRAGLLKVLPTSLGKDALLEAEVELRAYWDRTGPIPASDITQHGDDQGRFHLQWIFELLRLKCEAYSTLNETDEDPEAESRLQNRMSQGGGLSPPKPTLVAPASLYLTAILESVCEHILSNVGRVAARDSSRTSATAQDLFVALCEDDSIYALFKSMKIYEQVETLSKLSKPRRSKSSSRLVDKLNTSSQPDFKDTSRRTSSESSVSMATPAAAAANTGLLNSRTSFDKTKAMRMFNRASTDRDAGQWDQRNHKKSDSVEDPSRRTFDGSVKKDAAMLQEFDNLMRSDATMKVSLTPDRLKSMDVHNKEKNQRFNRQPFKPDEVEPPVPRTLGRRPSLRHAESIVEDDEEMNSPKSTTNRSRQTSSASARQDNTRIRSFSGSYSIGIPRKPSRTELDTSSPPPSSTTNVRRRPVPKALDTSGSNLPRTRKVPQDSLDLSDDDAQEAAATPPRRRTPFGVSSDTRDLIEFLSEGPPDDTPPVSMANSSGSPADYGKSKGSGRLQRMISKLSIGNSNEKSQSRGVNGSDEFSRKTSRKTPPTTPSTPVKYNVIPANKPIPPRPPPPPVISPPSSSQESLVDNTSRPYSSTNRQEQRSEVSIPSPASGKEARSPVLSPTTNGVMNGYKRSTDYVKPADSSVEKADGYATAKSPAEQRSSKKSPLPPSPAVERATSSQLSMDHAREMHSLFLKAVTADECRLIFDMFLAKSGMAVDPPKYIPPSSASEPSETDTDLEHLLVELLLGDGSQDASILQTAFSKVTLPSPTAIPAEPNEITA